MIYVIKILFFNTILYIRNLYKKINWPLFLNIFIRLKSNQIDNILNNSLKKYCLKFIILIIYLNKKHKATKD